MSENASLETRLAESLPESLNLRVYHVSTAPTKCPPILAGQYEDDTLCETHFLGVASEPQDHDLSLFIYAIEVLIFTTPRLITVFVSKADTTGFLARLDVPKNSPSIVKTITRVFLDFLLASRLDRARVVLSLFARSQNQYLFPGSIENPEKHVLDDRQLIKWWCRICDTIWRPYNHSTSHPGRLHRCNAHVVVPGCDPVETKAFFPATSVIDQADHPKWTSSYPVRFLTGRDDLPLREAIPRLPDDPKARFLDDLDGDYISPTGQWRSVKSLSQFWEMMSYRQECHAGRLVGFIWITFALAAPHDRTDVAPVATLTDSANVRLGQNLPTLSQSFSETTAQPDQLLPTPTISVHTSQLDSPPPSSPVRHEECRPNLSLDARREPEQARITARDSLGPALANGISPSDDFVGIRSSKAVTQGEVVLTAEDYAVLIDFLLELDFAGVGPAGQSTKDWTGKAIEVGKANTFGRSIVGRKQVSLIDREPAQEAGLTPKVNVLTGVRKKRKVDAALDTKPPVEKEVEAAVLASGLIRKKPKTDASAQT